MRHFTILFHVQRSGYDEIFEHTVHCVVWTVFARARQQWHDIFYVKWHESVYIKCILILWIFHIILFGFYGDHFDTKKVCDTVIAFTMRSNTFFFCSRNVFGASNFWKKKVKLRYKILNQMPRGKESCTKM